jgi:hypothetical protein
LGLEHIPLNAVFSGIIGATVFLLGFLLSGVMADYKESERIPGEIAAILATMTDEMECVRSSGKEGPAVEGLTILSRLGTAIHDWFHRRIQTQALMDEVRGMNAAFAVLEPIVPANYVARLKQEQNNLRKLLIRVHTIRDTDFVSSAYLIGTSTSILLMIGLVFAEIEPFFESLFFIGVISYLLCFLLTLIRDLDNPFGHYDARSYEDVSLKPIEDAIADIKGRVIPVDQPHEVAGVRS